MTKRFVPGYLDGELDLVRTIDFESHLKNCSECSRELENQRALQAAIHRGKPAYAAPSSLRKQILSLLDATDQKTGPVRRTSWGALRFLEWAAAFAVLIICTLVGWRLLPGPSNDQRIAAEVFSDHVRSLEASHLTDVTSTDQHTVKPWFDGKLDFSPPVEDLSSDGFPLIGGRLDYLEGREVAVLVYQRRKHFINLFVWPAANATNSPRMIEPRQGYNMLRWSRSGFEFWAISDVSSADLGEFARLLEAPTAPENK